MAKQVAVVTGANRGLGLETARQLCLAGYRVVATGRSLPRIQSAAATLEGDVVTMELDVADGASVQRFAEGLAETTRAVDVLVNNAGILPDGDQDPGNDCRTVSPETVLAAFHTNTLGAYRVTQAVLPLLDRARNPRIVNVSSGMGGVAEMGSGYPAYRLSKAALNALTRTLANDLGPKFKVNSVCPGWVRTDMGGARATRDLAAGGASIVWAATLGEDGPTGGFFRDGKRLAW